MIWRLKRLSHNQYTKQDWLWRDLGWKGYWFWWDNFPIVKMSSIHVILGLVVSMKFEIKQIDIKIVFLHGNSKKEIYMKQSDIFEVKGKEHLVCKRKKILYGLKQASILWYTKFDSFMMDHVYKITTSYHCVLLNFFLWWLYYLCVLC